MQNNAEQTYTRLGKNKLAELLNDVNKQLEKENLALRAERKDTGYRLKAVTPNSRANARGETLLEAVHPADIDTFAKGMLFSLATMGVKKQPHTVEGIKRGPGRPRKQAA